MPIKSILDWLGFHKAVEAPPEVRAEFQLFYGQLLVAVLSVADSVWKFEYSEAFRQQDELRPLVEFPDVDKVYESKELWQFFVMRIPSPEQPEIEEILKSEHIREDDAVTLLKRFGEHTITNQFRLQAASELRTSKLKSNPATVSRRLFSFLPTWGIANSPKKLIRAHSFASYLFFLALTFCSFRRSSVTPIFASETLYPKACNRRTACRI